MERDKSDRTTDDADRSVTRPTSPFGDVTLAELVESPSSGKANSHAIEDYYRPPRLTIAHLLVWTMLAAIWMKVSVVFEAGGAMPQGLAAWAVLCIKGAVYSSTIVSAAGVLGGIVLLCDKLRGASGRLQPGHWFVLIISTSCLVQTLTSLLHLIWTGSFSHMSGSENDLHAAQWLIDKAAIEGASGVVFLWLVVKLREGVLWRILALTLAILGIAEAAYYMTYALVTGYPSQYFILQILSSIMSLASLAMLLVLLATVLVDLTRHRHRDGLHWLGLVLATVGGGYVFSMWILYLIVSTT